LDQSGCILRIPSAIPGPEKKYRDVRARDWKMEQNAILGFREEPYEMCPECKNQLGSMNSCNIPEQVQEM
jgi:hypothetical protein